MFLTRESSNEAGLSNGILVGVGAGVGDGWIVGVGEGVGVVSPVHDVIRTRKAENTGRILNLVPIIQIPIVTLSMSLWFSNIYFWSTNTRPQPFKKSIRMGLTTSGFS